ELIAEQFREDPRLVVLVGAELAAHQRLKLFNAADRPSDVNAAQMATSSVAGRFAFIPPFMPGKRLAVTTLDNLHIYTQAITRWFRA
ncbi:TPA: P2 family phage major capsid protein, partial [Escherichia coli]